MYRGRRLAERAEVSLGARPGVVADREEATLAARRAARRRDRRAARLERGRHRLAVLVTRPRLPVGLLMHRHATRRRLADHAHLARGAPARAVVALGLTVHRPRRARSEDRPWDRPHDVAVREVRVFDARARAGTKHRARERRVLSARSKAPPRATRPSRRGPVRRGVAWRGSPPRLAAASRSLRASARAGRSCAAEPAPLGACCRSTEYGSPHRA